jgi:hypothetical protein
MRESTDTLAISPEKTCRRPIQSNTSLARLRSQVLGMQSQIALERGDLEVAREFAHRAAHSAREASVTEGVSSEHLLFYFRHEADILESLGRLDEALALDAECRALNLGPSHLDLGLWVRNALMHVAAGEDDAAEQTLRACLAAITQEHHHSILRKMAERMLRPYILLAELLERRGTEEALAEAGALRDKAAHQLADHETRTAAAFESTRAEAAEAVTQWREERSKARGAKKGGKGKKKKGRRGKTKGKGASPAAATIEGEPPRELAGGEAEGAAAGEGAATAEAEPQAPEGESQPRDEDATREECAICLQSLELEDGEDNDEGGKGEALVVLRCGHRFHKICGDMWCAKCAAKCWGVTCPGCRAPYLLK